MSGSNGKHKKIGRPKAGEQKSYKIIQKAAIESDGSPTVMGEKLGIDKTSAQYHLQKPEIKEAVLNAREVALKKANLTLERSFQRVSEGMDATVESIKVDKDTKEITVTEKPHYKERRESTKIALQLLGELTQDEKEGLSKLPPIIMPVILVNGVPLEYNFGNGKHQSHITETP